MSIPEPDGRPAVLCQRLTRGVVGAGVIGTALRWADDPWLCGSLIRYSMPVYPGDFTYPVSSIFLPLLQRISKKYTRGRATGSCLRFGGGYNEITPLLGQ